jgi:hypothetical protein
MAWDASSASYEIEQQRPDPLAAPNLDRLPTTGALTVVSPPKPAGGTGSTSRVFALGPKG